MLFCRMNALVSLKYGFDSSVTSSVNLEIGGFPKPSRCLSYLCINPALQWECCATQKSTHLAETSRKTFAPWLRFGKKLRRAACLGMCVTSFTELEWCFWLLKVQNSNLWYMFCLHFIWNASCSLPFMFNSRFLSPRLQSGLQTVYVGTTLFFSFLPLRMTNVFHSNAWLFC